VPALVKRPPSGAKQALILEQLHRTEP